MKSIFLTLTFMLLIKPVLGFSKVDMPLAYRIKIDRNKKIVFVYILDELQNNKDVLDLLEAGLEEEFDLKVVPIQEMQISTNFWINGGTTHQR